MTVAQAQETLAAIKRHGGNITKAAEATGIPRSTMEARARRAPQVIQLAHTAELAPDTDAAVAQERRRTDDRIRDLERENRDLSRQLYEANDIRASVLKLKEEPPDPVAWRKTAKGKHSTVLLPLLFTSDFQCGEVIKPEEIDGLNAYNMDIFAERYQTLIDRTIDLSTHHVGRAEFPGIIYCRGGDAISGEIHAELQKTNDLSAAPAVKWLVRHEKEGIRRLRDKFGRVQVISIPGNHGRTTFKPEAKGYVAQNYETILAWWLESIFEGDSKVTFVTPPSGDAYFKALHWNVLMSHGDRTGSRGGQGFIGPAATILRGHRKLYENFTRSGKPVDVILTGHHHTSLRLELGFANGSLAGYSEYARDLRASIAPALQWLLFFHEQRKISHMFEVQLSEQPLRQLEQVA